MRVIFIIHMVIFSLGVFSQTTGYVLQKADGTIEIPDSSISTVKISGLLALLGTKQNLLGFTPYNATNPNGYISGITSGNVTTALGFTPKSVTDSGRATSNYVTGGSLKKLNDSTIAAMATLYGNDYRAANFIAGTNYLAPNGNGSSLTGLTATQVGLGNVTNESKATMFTSPTFTGTAALGTSPTMTTPNITTGFKIGGAAAVNNTLFGDGTNYTPLTTRGNYQSFAVSGSNATTTGQSLTDITGLVSGTLSNSTTYEVEAMLYVTTSAVTTGTQYGIGAGGSGGAAVVEVLVIGTTTVNATTAVTENAASTAQGTFLTTSGSSGIIWIKGIVTTRGSGTATISIQHLKVTSGTSTVNIGSWMKIRQLN